MPSLTFKELQEYSTIKTSIFIETGTLMGDTVQNIVDNFEVIYSIELSSYYADLAKSRFKNNNNVTIIQGDSSVILGGLCQILDKAAFFWLDGHWSGGNTARGSKDCPLLEEISIINNMFKKECIIAIDDIRLFGTKVNEDWTNIKRETILEIVKDRLISCKYYPSNIHPEDRMVLTLKQIM